MYVKEEKAYLMECPFKLSQNLSPKDNTACHGRDCMAWRWKPEINHDWKPKYDMMIIEDGHDYRTDPPPYIESRTHGYCGMATRPNFNNG